jgi:hypothetical protein
VFKVNPSLAVKVNEIITNTQSLISILRRANSITRDRKRILKNLNVTLASFHTSVSDLVINFWDRQSTCRKNKLILGFNDLSEYGLVKLILEQRHEEIEAGLVGGKNAINASVVNEFINNLNNESLRLVVKDDPVHADFLMQLFVLLRQPAAMINQLTSLVKQSSIAANESELKANIALVGIELKKTIDLLANTLAVVRQSREHGVATQRLISVYNETELTANPEQLIKSYLISQLTIPDLVSQVAYDYFAITGEVPRELDKFNDFNNRSKYFFIKSFLLN